AGSARVSDVADGLAVAGFALAAPPALQDMAREVAAAEAELDRQGEHEPAEEDAEGDHDHVAADPDLGERRREREQQDSPLSRRRREGALETTARASASVRLHVRLRRSRSTACARRPTSTPPTQPSAAPKATSVSIARTLGMTTRSVPTVSRTAVQTRSRQKSAILRTSLRRCYSSARPAAGRTLTARRATTPGRCPARRAPSRPR